MWIYMSTHKFSLVEAQHLAPSYILALIYADCLNLGTTGGAMNFNRA